MRLSSGRTQVRTVLASNFTLDFEPQKFLLPQRPPSHFPYYRSITFSAAFSGKAESCWTSFIPWSRPLAQWAFFQFCHHRSPSFGNINTPFASATSTNNHLLFTHQTKLLFIQVNRKLSSFRSTKSEMKKRKENICGINSLLEWRVRWDLNPGRSA